MPVYNFQGYDLDGNGISGSEFADSPPALQEQLTQRGIVVENYTCKNKKSQPLNFGRILKPDDLILLLQEFVSLLAAGFPIPRVLQMLSDRPEQPRLQQVLNDILTRVEQGENLSDAISSHPKVFDDYLVTSVRIGEKSGDLVEPLKRYIAYRKIKQKLAKSIKQALAYPIFLMLTMMFVIIALFTFVLPRFVEMYSGFNAELPAPTLLLMSVVENFPLYGGLGIGVFGAGFVIIKMYISTEYGRYRFDQFRLHMPVFGRMVRLFSIAQMTRVLATLIKSGVTVVEALQKTADGINNKVLSLQINMVSRKIEEGASLADAMKLIKIFPAKSLKLIAAGEESGRLEELLINITEYHEELFESAIKKIVTLVEPIIMLFIGLFVGGIILVMYLPIFSVAEIVQ